jgi:hypothetical protein
MKNNNPLFLGKPLHWLLWIVLIGVLYVLGANSFHVRHFIAFCLILLALSAACVIIIIAGYRDGERITREPFE